MIEKEMTRLIMENTMTNMSFVKVMSDELMVGLDLQNHLVSPNCSVASTTCCSIHSRIHSTADRAQRSTNP